MKKINLLALAVLIFAGSTISSCNSIKNANNTQKGAVIGATAGAVLGGVVGNNVKNKNSALGAVLGGVVGGTVGAIIGKNMDKQAQEIEQNLPGAKVERVGEGIRVVLNEQTINFAFDSSELSSQAQSNLDKIAKVFKDHPRTLINIYGYTDNKGKDAYNEKLSRNRANAVKKYLAKQGVGIRRITTFGMGPADPIASNDTDAGRAQNRRVEFSIVADDEMIYDARREANNY